jgi:hypothetical protein
LEFVPCFLSDWSDGELDRDRAADARRKLRGSTGFGFLLAPRLFMVRTSCLGATVIVATVLPGSAMLAFSQSGHGHVNASERKALLRRAQIWKPTDVASMNIVEGPQRKDGFKPGETVTCDYVDEKLNGNSPKFGCKLTHDDTLKVRYGRDNGEVYASVASSRLLWALGFGADALYPVQLICRGCPRELGLEGRPEPGQVRFDIATIERKMPGREIEAPSVGPGWAWPELDEVDESGGGAPRAQRDALKLLAILLQHTDNKPEQQKLLCLDGHESKTSVAACKKPFLMIHDLGETFGHANLFNRDSVGSTNLKQWTEASVWKDAARCIGNLSQSQTGTLADPPISEAGRKFLDDLLARLTDNQLRDLFTVARFAKKPGLNGQPKGASVDDWVAAFKKKRDEIAAARCIG